MPIVDLTARHRELGRLKFGEDAGDRPRTLETWRLTSPHRDLLEAAAELFGGTVSESGDGFELITDRPELTVYLPRQNIAAGQWFELWTAGGLQRRCDGEHLAEGTNQLDATEADRTAAGLRCVCDPDDRECKPTTVLRVVLPELPDLGVWRLTTRSYYAAAELPQAAELLFATSTAPLVPAVLALDHRKTKRPGERTKRYTVPILRTSSTLLELVGRPASPQLEASTVTGELTRAPESHETPFSAPEAHEEELEPVAEPWRALGDFLVLFHPSELGHNTGDLITKLEALEELMLTVGLWHTTEDGRRPLDISAGRHFGDDQTDPEPHDTLWRSDTYKTDRLRAFAQRAAMAAHTATNATRLGSRALAEAEAALKALEPKEETTP